MTYPTFSASKHELYFLFPFLSFGTDIHSMNLSCNSCLILKEKPLIHYFSSPLQLPNRTYQERWFELIYAGKKSKLRSNWYVLFYVISIKCICFHVTLLLLKRTVSTLWFCITDIDDIYKCQSFLPVSIFFVIILPSSS